MKAALEARAVHAEHHAQLAASLTPNSVSTPATSPTWAGITDPNWQPSDSTGAIGLDRYIEFVNSSFGVFDRSGHLIDSGGLGHLMASTNVVDPQVLWGSQTRRFYYAGMSETNALTGSGSNELLFRWSRSPFPSSPNDWCSYFVKFGSTIPDFPKLGDMTGFIAIGLNDFSSPASYVSSELDVFSKPPSGSTCESYSSITYRFFTGLRNADSTLAFTPVPVYEIDTESVGYVLAAPDVNSSGAGTYVTLYAISNVGGIPSLSTPTSVSVPSFSMPPPVPQSGSTYTLDSLDGRLTNAVGAYDPVLGRFALWSQHTVAGGMNGSCGCATW